MQALAPESMFKIIPFFISTIQEILTSIMKVNGEEIHASGAMQGKFSFSSVT